MNSNTLLAGIEIGGTKLQLSIGDGSGVISHSTRYEVQPMDGAEAIRNKIREGMQCLRDFDKVAAIGVGFGGPVNWQTGKIFRSHQVTGWADFNLKEWFEGITGKFIVIDNDANVAALAEATRGIGKDFKRVFYMTIGSGIGGGFVIDGKIYHGLAPGEVEIGHIKLNKNGTTLESSCSGWAVNNRVKEYVNTKPGSLLAKLSKEFPGPESSWLHPALVEDDRDAVELIEEVADDLSFALSHVVHLFHPDIIIIGGGLSLLGEQIRKPILQRISKYVMEAFHPLPPIELSSLGEGVVPIGAIELAKLHYLVK